MIRLTTPVSMLVTLTLAGILTAPALAQTANAPYELSVFAHAPKGSSAPDSIAVLHNQVFIAYGDGHDPAGKDGLNSEIVEYRMDGTIVHTYTVPGHSDGLKVDPYTADTMTSFSATARPTSAPPIRPTARTPAPPSSALGWKAGWWM